MTKYLIATEGLLKGLILSLEDKDEYRIGRDPEIADLLLSDPSVSREHALIFKKDANFYIKDLTHTNPTFVNDELIIDSHLLEEGDEIKIGKTTFEYSSTPPEEKKEEDSEKGDERLLSEETKNLETIIEPIEPEDKESEEKKESLNIEEPIKGEIVEEEKVSSQEENNLKTIKQKAEEEDISAYDTIFEEETEEEVPFNLISENAFILKVISGSNAGAEFGMEKGRSYIIGKNPSSCDIVFNDLSVSKEHAKITIDSEGLCYIEDLGSKNGVIVNSKKIDTKEIISSKDLIVLGATTFIVLDPSQIQETLYAIPPPAYEEKVEEKKEEGIAVEAKEEETSWHKLIIPKKHLVIAGSLFTILFIIFMTFFSLFTSKKVETKHKEPNEEIKKAIEKFSDVQFSYNPAIGKLFLVGHILTAIDEQELLYNLQAVPFIESVENNIIIDEYVWKNMNDLLNSNTSWRSANIHSPKAGVFLVSGYVQSADQLTALSDYLKANFPYVDRLQNKVVIEDVLKSEIAGLIISNGLSAISYQLASGEVILAGRYAKEDSSTYEKLLDQLKKLDGIRSVKNAAVATTADLARIDLTAKYRITGIITSDDKKPVSVVANNKLINVDSSLDGMKITEIRENTIYLEKDGLKYKIDYIR